MNMILNTPYNRIDILNILDIRMIIMNSNNYKKQLKKQKQELENLISEMEDNTLFGDTTHHTSERYSSGELSSYDNHPGDIGTEVYMNDMQNSLTDHQKYQLDKVNEALSKIDDNSFGYCERCHHKIEQKDSIFFQKLNYVLIVHNNLKLTLNTIILSNTTQII